MVGADDSSIGKTPLFLGAKYRASMPAGIVESAKDAVTASGDNDLLRANCGDEKVPFFRNLFKTSDGYPVPVPDCLEFALIVIGVDIPAGRQRWMESRSVRHQEIHLRRSGDCSAKRRVLRY